MTWAFLSLRKMQLKQRLNNYQTRLLEISQRIMDMHELGAAVADGKITYQEAATTPSSVFGTQLGFMGQAATVAYQSAQIKTNAYLQQMQTLNQTTGGQYQYAIEGTTTGSLFVQNGQVNPSLIFNEIYKEEMENYASQYSEMLNREEQDLEQERLTLETQIKAIQAEYDTVSQTEEQNIKNDAIKLT